MLDLLLGTPRRTIPRPRRAVPLVVLVVMRPAIRYSEWRGAWILRGVGDHVGPVFVRRELDRRDRAADRRDRAADRSARAADRRALAERTRRAPDDRLGGAGQGRALERTASRPKLKLRPRPATELPLRTQGQASPRPAQPRRSDADAPVATRVQVPRATRAGATRDARRRRRRSRPSAGGRLAVAPSVLLVGFGLAAAAAAVSLALVNTGGGRQQPSGVRLTAGVLELPVPAGWTREAPTAARTLGLVDSVALRTKPDASGTLIVGRAATTAGLLPQQLSATLAGTPAPQLVTLGGAQYYRYLDVTPRAGGGSESVYTMSTTAGTMLAVCVQHRPGSNLAAMCERVLGAAKLTAGTTTANPEPSYAAAFTAVIRKLNAVRVRATARLSNAQGDQEQASAAAALAAGHLQAAAALERLNAGPATSANASVATTIRAIGRAYRSLGQAAAHGDTAAYHAALTEISHTTADLSSAFAGLRALGYPVQSTPA
jgi:hypothetical protein